MLNQFFGKQKESRLQNRPRQRQRMSRKMLIILGSSIACLVIALVVVMNVSKVEQAKAEAMKGATDKNVIIIPDDIYSTAVSLNDPPAARTMSIPKNAQLGHVAKPLPQGN